MPDYRVASYVEEGLEEGVRLILCESVGKVQTFGTSSDNGLKRVPLEGPPTCTGGELEICSLLTESLRE